MGLGFSTDARANIHSDALKKQLLECINNEKENFLEIAKIFDQKEQRTKEDYLGLSQQVIKAIDQVLQAGDWEDSLFLRNTVKPLKKIRDAALELQEQARATSGEKKLTLRDLENDETLVYISIFQSEGHNIRKWELQLSSLRSHLLGRPVYEKEEDVQKVIRQKLIQISEAYVVVAIKQSDFQDFSYQEKRVDRSGNTLLTLKEKAVKPENIFKFIHQGKQYYFVKGKLVEAEV